MRHKFYITAILILMHVVSLAQNTEIDPQQLTLNEAIDYALENNYQAINARRDIAAALKQKWETTATGLPQINGQGQYNYNIELPLTPLPAQLVDPMASEGEFVAVPFAPKQSMQFTASLSQLLFDGSYLVALEASKTFLQFSKNANAKTKLEVRRGVINSYGATLVAEENVELTRNNLQTLQKNLDETKEIFKNGFAEEEDVEQLQITLSQVQNMLSNAERQLEISYQMLKLTMGMPINTPIALVEEVEGLTMENVKPVPIVDSLQLNDNIDYRIAQNLTEQRRLEWKLERSKSLPTLGGFLNYGVNTFDEDFIFFNSSTQWFDQSAAGVQLNVPIFSSFQRRARQQRAEIAYEQSQTQLTETEQQLQLEYQTALNNYAQALDSYRTAQQNLDLAERIEKKNQIKFTEGIATSFDLRQAQTQLYAVQGEYLQSMLNVIQTQAAIETLRNEPQIFGE